MSSTSCNLYLFLGRHESPFSGLWVYGYSLADALLQESEGRSICRTFTCAAGGEESLDRQLSNLKREHAGLELKNESLPRGAFGRRIDQAVDIFRRTGKHDLIHGTANVVPLFGSGKKILTLHDLLQCCPGVPSESLYESLKRLWYRIQFKFMLARVNLIVTDHGETKRKIVELFNPKAPVVVVYPGLARQYLEAPLHRERGKKKSFLAFASRDPRKNIDKLLEAFQKMSQEDPEVSLTLIASTPQVAGQWKEKLLNEASLSRVTVECGIPAEKMPDLYATHSALLFPSRSEGFGYPIYEALSQGTPVLCSREMLIDELKGVEAFVENCSPKSVQSIYEGMHTLLQREFSEERRAFLASEVRELLDFRRSAREMLLHYENLMSQSG